MVEDSDRHETVLDELVEWWEDLSRRKVNSRAVLLPVPSKWGRTHLLDRFAAAVEADDAVCIVVRVDGARLPDGLGEQASELRDLFSDARIPPSVAEVLGVDRLGGAILLGLGVGGLFPVPLAGLVLLLVASIGAGAAGKRWDDSAAGQEGTVAKMARAVAAMSVSVPVVVIIDDADRLEPDLAVVLIENLIERIAGRVLVVGAVDPGGELQSALISRARYGLTEGRVRTVDADPDMSYQARVDLASQLCPGLPAAATRLIGQRTRALAEVFKVAAAERLAELETGNDDITVVKAVGEVIDAEVSRASPSKQAVVLGWAKCVLHVRQAERAVDVLDQGARDDDGDVLRFETLVRLADPASPRIKEQVSALAHGKRQQLAKVVLDTAVEIGESPEARLVEKVVAWQAAHQVRAYLQDRAQLPSMQCQLVDGLEDLSDPAAAYQVAQAALADLEGDGQPGNQNRQEHDKLSAAVIRLRRKVKALPNDPLIGTTVAAAAARGAAVGLEARIWAAIDLLGQPDQQERAIELAGQITAELNKRDDMGVVGSRWRLLLAFHVGRAGYPALSEQLLAPILSASDLSEYSKVAQVLRKIDGPRADTRLQIIGLEAELQALPPAADSDRLRIHHVLAADYGDLGEYARALRHAQDELSLRHRSQGADHRDTLATRGNIAFWTGWCGNVGEALRLSEELLPHLERVLGPGHPDTLWTRRYIAYWTGEHGDVAGALRLAKELLRDCKAALGPNHPDTLTAQYELAFWTGEHGNAREALRLFRELLPDRDVVLGPDHVDTLDTRGNIAGWTGWCGDAPEALRLFEELLPDRERILGPDHPDVLVTRSCIAYWTARCGDATKALWLFQELPRSAEQVLGSDHPDTLAIRNYVADLSSRDVERLFMFPFGPVWTGH
jgi:hypothetical protein